MAWPYLIVAGLCEIAWPAGLKLSQTPGRLALGVVVAVVGIATSAACPGQRWITLAFSGERSEPAATPS